MDHLTKPEVLAVNHGISPIGAAQRTIAFTVVASGGTGLINITAAAHGLKKGQCFNIVGGAYAGVHRVKKVISANVIQVEFAFGATAAGDLKLLSHLNGSGFYVDSVPLTIAELEVDNDTVDTTAIIAQTFIAGQYYAIPFKKIRITAGNIRVVRAPVRTDLGYTRK
jgi:hypothetical protein